MLLSVFSQVTSVAFGVYSEEEIRKLSVLQVSNPTTFNALLHPTQTGAYAPALGPLDQGERCVTCGQLGVHCPGHMGHIELPLPVYHPMFFGEMFRLLRSMCFYCHALRAPPLRTKLLQYQLELLDSGLLTAAQDLETALIEDDGVEALEADKPEDVATSMLARLEERYKAALQRNNLRKAKPGAASHAHILGFRQEIINAYSKSCTSKRKCSVREGKRGMKRKNV